MGHRKNNCSKAKACRVYHKKGHEPGSPECECEHHVSSSENIVAFQVKDNPIPIPAWYPLNNICLRQAQYIENDRFSDHLGVIFELNTNENI